MAAVIASGLACPICFEILDDPKQLACGHTFCRKCLDELRRSSSQLNCPVCRQFTTVPDGGAANLPTNIALEGLVKHIRGKKTDASTSTTRTYCTANCQVTDEKTAVSYCKICNVSMCESCHEVHGNLKQNSGHTAVSLKELSENYTDTVLNECKIISENVRETTRKSASARDKTNQLHKRRISINESHDISCESDSEGLTLDCKNIWESCDDSWNFKKNIKHLDEDDLKGSVTSATTGVTVSRDARGDCINTFTNQESVDLPDGASDLLCLIRVRSLTNILIFQHPVIMVLPSNVSIITDNIVAELKHDVMCNG